MGRSRAFPHPLDDDPGQRSKRKRTTSSVENLETACTGLNDGKWGLYHCNYCNKDVSGKIRIKCVMCPDFDLCIECFSVGAELTPHKSNHPYRVMDNLSLPLICPDWNADEEILLLEGIEMYGLGNWTEVAEHVGTKSRSECLGHYNAIYMNSPCFPLPDMSHVMGKNREELLAMTKEHCEAKKGFPMHGELTLKEESPLSAKEKVEGPAGRSSSSTTAVVSFGMGSSSGNTSASAVKKASNVNQIRDDYDGVKVEADSQADRSIGEKKPRTSGDEGPSLTEFSGYNPKRQEFEIEYDNEAEQLLADMEFKDTDTDAERELKLRVLRIYLKRLDERKRRKDFILERNLLYPDPFEKNLSLDGREIYQQFKVFMQFQSKEEHEAVLKSIIEEYEIGEIIEDLQEARKAGCCSSAEADVYIQQKRKKEAEESARRLRESSQAGPSGKLLQKANHPKGEFVGSSPRGAVGGCKGLETGGNDSSASSVGSTISRRLGDWDITGLLGADLLSENEKRLCGEIKILPSHYLNMLYIMSIEMMNGNISQKSDAHCFFKVHPSKVDRVYDMLMKKRIVRS
ncbi:transcriptional adapter ADA2-like isoform X2 [Malania oleifera]|uniref:transcriptional adapter ADA2-like isoform X2 n=1 Tax=Malania oleifera TaxID=397392 RepID=UPI0025AE1108|nr:transcriptional adapter ADA2-like isoform X2 [Malania oleifera]XP_057955541.1 transcriptional adapter ADA2-like isoform X2 [Malania oleifera]